MTLLDNISIILVRPQLGDNVGSAARAMKNFGITDMRLVSPTCDIPNERAEAIACHAKDIFLNAKIFDNIQDAVSDLNIVYATTARERYMNKETISSNNISIPNMDSKIGVMFGPENNGLNNSELSFAQKIIYINTSDLYRSINLAQSICVICYEMHNIYLKTQNLNDDINTLDKPAPYEDVLNLYNNLVSTLESKNFFSEPNLKNYMKITIMNMLNKANFSEQEIRTFHGIIKGLIKNSVDNE